MNILYNNRLLFYCFLEYKVIYFFDQNSNFTNKFNLVHYSLNDVQIGFPNSALFVGMMLGSLFWGGHSDIHGRRDAFHWTLTITTVGGLLCGFTPSFELLNLFLVILGFGVGGAVPVDSSIILEFLPTKYHYIVTSLSVFVNLGGVLASYFAYIILPIYSCPEAASHNPTLPCDVDVSNNGWRYVFISLSIVNGLMAFWRVFLFKLPESPHYLLSNNKFQGVVDTLNQVAECNGLSTRFTVNDLIPTRKSAEMEEYCEESENNEFGLEHEPHSFNNNQSNFTSANKFTFVESGIKTHWLLKLLGFDWNLVYNLFQPYYRLSTILMWTIWTLMALSYNLFTIFLPKYLEIKGQKEGSGTMGDVYWSYLIYSLCGIPGSLVGGWLVDTKLGRRGTLALSILLDAFAQLGFIFFQSLTLVTISSSAASFLITLMYAVLYSYTPEIFDPRLRSTACGIAVSLSRL